MRRPGRVRGAWSGLTVAGVVVLAGAVVADALREPPRGGLRLAVGLAVGFALLGLGYALRRGATRDP
jgi:hypothetical protein